MINPADLAGIKSDQAFIDAAFKKIPAAWAKPVSKTYAKKLKSHGRQAANLSVLDVLDAVDGFRFGVAGDDDELISFAKARADECFRAATRYQDKDQSLDAMIAVALRYGIAAPAGRNVTKTGQRMRLLDFNWWRRNVRKTAARNVEAAAIKVGMVSRVAGLYASDDAVKRRKGQRARNAAILAGITCENSQGQQYTLKQLSDLGVSNPEKRRMELMTRIAGFDQVAIKHGHAAEFYTLTAPSKYHARHHIHGRENPNYNGATPAETQAYLCKIFSQIRTKLHRDGIDYYGFRVCEPHHDGTPHWHLLVFCPVENVETLRAVFKHYALKEDGTEPGADVHRFKAEKIDRKRGSAAGYIAKYISKNIDGQNNEGQSIGEDYEAVAGEDEATQTARRVDAWASTWGIRQFQPLGGQSVTTWRELRRGDPGEVENEKLKAIVEAADAGAWDRYTELNGGVIRSFYEFPRFSKKTGKPLKNGHKAIKTRHVTTDKEGNTNSETGEIRTNIYTEPAADRVIGFKGFGEAINTHLETWVFKRSGAAGAPRSSVNNCTQKDLKNNVREKKKARIRYLREIKKRPLSEFLPITNRKLEFLTGESLKLWEITNKIRPADPQQQTTHEAWAPCLRVLTHSSLRSTR